MQGLLMTLFAVVASIFRMTPCMKAQQKKSEALHKELQLAYVGAAHPVNGVTTKMENSKVSKYVVPGNNSEIERKLRSLEKQIQQLRNNEVLMKVTDLD